jgi:hypothetical protein
VADLANPGFALYRTPRNKLFRSKAYEGHYLLYPAALFKKVKLGKKGSDGCLPDPLDRQQEIFFVLRFESFLMCSAICFLSFSIS